MVYQAERGEKTNRLHYQGYVEFKKPTRVNRAKELLGDNTVHLEGRKGTRDEARNYCMKEDTRVDGPFEFGTWHAVGAGRRSDLEKVVNDVKEGVDMKVIAERYPEQFVKYHRGLEKLRRVIMKPRSHKEEVTNIILWGDAGVGKTKWVWENKDKFYYGYCEPRWFDQYNGEEACLFDDFDGQMDVGTFKKICDRYPCVVHTKGGTVEFNSKFNIFTSNVNPKEWYRPVHWNALQRRMNHIIEWRENHKQCTVCGAGCSFLPQLEPSDASA